MVAPLLEVLLLRVLRRRGAAAPPARPTRLVGPARPVDSLGHVLDGTSVLLAREGEAVEVLGPGSLVWPPLLGPGRTTYAVVTHAPVAVWMRIGPFDSGENRPIHQIELRLQVTLTDAPSGLRDLLEADALSRGATSSTAAGAHRSDGSARTADPGSGPLDGFGDRLLERLAEAVASRTADAVRRHTIDQLADLSLKVVLDEALPTTFLGGALTRTSLEVLDVDWPTQGRGWPPVLAPVGVAVPGLPRAPRA